MGPHDIFSGISGDDSWAHQVVDYGLDIPWLEEDLDGPWSRQSDSPIPTSSWCSPQTAFNTGTWQHQQHEAIGGNEEADSNNFAPLFPLTKGLFDDLNLEPLATSSSTMKITPDPSPADLDEASRGTHVIANSAGPPKVGTRFTRKALRILNDWFRAHSNKPYPSDAEKRMLQERTGLTKDQVNTWLANARRRNKINSSRTLPTEEKDHSQPMRIPRRPPTPAMRSGSSLVNPLERWVESPPEHEPASASAIARAVATSPLPFNDSSDSLEYPYPSPSVGSVDNSISSFGSFSSAHSNASKASIGSFVHSRHARSRRRRRATKWITPKKLSQTAGKIFQCTFCTETFARKYDWRRHENSLHLSLERWICAANGPRGQNPHDKNLVSCVFCGISDPTDDHIEEHNYESCQARPLAEHIFSRKDHLRQHLRLFHGCTFLDWSMEEWRVPVPDIRSRCGFCNLVMTSWDERAAHLSDHFKVGKTMADWNGDWGFESSILDIVENAIPPYMIDFERNSPNPYQGSKGQEETPRNAYELIKLELAHFMQKYFDKHSRMPKVRDMQLEATRIILASREETGEEKEHSQSWLQDLILSNQEVVAAARVGPLRSSLESTLFSMKINGKSDLFEGCSLESRLQHFVRSGIQDHHITDHALTEEACNIVVAMEQVSTTPSDFIATWLVRLIHASTDWLSAFRKRTNLPLIHDTISVSESDRQAIHDDSLQSNTGLVSGALVSDTTLLDSSKSENQANKLRMSQGQEKAIQKAPGPLQPRLQPAIGTQQPSHVPFRDNTDNMDVLPSDEDEKSLLIARTIMLETYTYLPNNPSFFRWLDEELSRWAIATMSAHNPTQHVPTDEEIQHYARWIVYNDGDPLNQTLADNPYWLGVFKQKFGISDNRTEL